MTHIPKGWYPIFCEECRCVPRMRYPGDDPENGPAERACDCDSCWTPEECFRAEPKRPPGVRLRRHSKIIGPQHDPYEVVTRTVLTAADPPSEVRLVWDSFSERTYVVIDGWAADDLSGEEAAARFRELTGIDPLDFDELYYGEGGEGWRDPEVEAAERDAGWDPNP